MRRLTPLPESTLLIVFSMEILHLILGIIVVLLLLLAALRWSVVAAERGGHQARDSHFKDLADGSGHDNSHGEGDE